MLCDFHISIENFVRVSLFAVQVYYDLSEHLNISYV